MFKAHDALICIGEKTYVDETQRKKFNNQHFLKNKEEVMKLYEDLPEAMINNNNFPQRFILSQKNPVQSCLIYKVAKNQLRKNLFLTLKKD